MSMTDDYLWDGCGTPDPEIQHLETILAEFRHRERPLFLPAIETPVAIRKARSVLQSPWLSRCAAAAVILLAITLGILFSRHAGYNAPGVGPSWNVANLEGNPQIGSQSVLANQSTAKLYVGQTLTTNASSRATLSEDDLGQIQIDPNSRVRLLRTDPNHKRLQLEVGTIHAAIWAPPGQFVVDTPSAVAIDLGSHTRCKSRATAPAPFAPRSAGLASISTAATRSSPRVPCVLRVRRSARAFRILKMPANRFATLCILLIKQNHRRKLLRQPPDDSFSGATTRRPHALASSLSHRRSQTRAGVCPVRCSRASAARRDARRHPRPRPPHARPLLERALPRRHFSLALLGTIVRSTRHTAAPANPHEEGRTPKENSISCDPRLRHSGSLLWCWVCSAVSSR